MNILLSVFHGSVQVRMQVVSGLLDEAHALMEAGLKAGSAPITRAIGYRQALEWLEQISEAGVAVEADVRRLASAIQAASRQLAGSQIKFHRGDEHFKWVDASAGPKALTDYIIDHFNAPDHCGVLLVLCACAVHSSSRVGPSIVSHIKGCYNLCLPVRASFLYPAAVVELLLESSLLSAWASSFYWSECKTLLRLCTHLYIDAGVLYCVLYRMYNFK